MRGPNWEITADPHVVKTPLPAGEDSRRSLSTRHIAWRLLPEDFQRVSDEAPTVLRDNEFLRAFVDGQVALLDERTPNPDVRPEIGPVHLNAAQWDASARGDEVGHE